MNQASKTMPQVLVIRGPLGVGKTTVSKMLAQKLNAEYISLDQILDDNHLVAPDADGIPVEAYLKANEIIMEKVSRTDTTCIVDGCFYYQEQIDDLTKKCAGNIEFFSLVSDVEKCIERDSKRPKVFGEDSARYVHMITTKIKAGIEIDTNNLTVEETVDKIVKILDEPKKRFDVRFIM